MSEAFVETFMHLKNKPKADRALQMLQKIASLVKPIMRKHGWKLPLLAEFFPDNPGLLGLNINGGQKICIRLRPSHASDTFYHEADLVQTMLHELTHNVHGPHDEKFYKYLSGLQDEYDALQRSGYAGEGFFSKGHRLGSNVSHNVPPHMARAKALEAAEKRRQTSRILGGGGRLGNGVNAEGLSPRELAAQAAERRARDEKSCASGTIADLEAARAAKDSIENHVIDLTLDESYSGETTNVHHRAPVAGLSKVSNLQTLATKSSPSTLPPVNHAAESSQGRSITAKFYEPSAEWPCPACTLLNRPMALQCDACSTIRPQTTTTGWACFNCGEFDIPHERCMCQICGPIKK